MALTADVAEENIAGEPFATVGFVANVSAMKKVSCEDEEAQESDREPILETVSAPGPEETRVAPMEATVGEGTVNMNVSGDEKISVAANDELPANREAEATVEDVAFVVVDKSKARDVVESYEAEVLNRDALEDGASGSKTVESGNGASEKTLDVLPAYATSDTAGQDGVALLNYVTMTRTDVSPQLDDTDASTKDAPADDGCSKLTGNGSLAGPQFQSLPVSLIEKEDSISPIITLPPNTIVEAEAGHLQGEDMGHLTSALIGASHEGRMDGEVTAPSLAIDDELSGPEQSGVDEDSIEVTADINDAIGVSPPESHGDAQAMVTHVAPAATVRKGGSTDTPVMAVGSNADISSLDCAL